MNIIIGETARNPIPIRTLAFVRRLRKEEPGVHVWITHEQIALERLRSTRWGIDPNPVVERIDQINIGFETPLEVFRGRLDYLLNGHHRGVAALEVGVETQSAFVINTGERTRHEAEYLDPISEKVLFSITLSELRTKHQIEGLEPRNKRIGLYQKKLRELCPGLQRYVEKASVDTPAVEARDLVLKLLSVEDFENTVDKFEASFGLSLSDLQIICMMRDSLRRKRLYDRLLKINSSNPNPCLQKKIEGFGKMALLTFALIKSGPDRNRE